MLETEQDYHSLNNMVTIIADDPWPIGDCKEKVISNVVGSGFLIKDRGFVYLDNEQGERPYKMTIKQFENVNLDERKFRFRISGL